MVHYLIPSILGRETKCKAMLPGVLADTVEQISKKKAAR